MRIEGRYVEDSLWAQMANGWSVDSMGGSTVGDDILKISKAPKLQSCA